MKKIEKRLFILGLILGVLLVTGCKEPEEEKTAASVVGKWEYTDPEGDYITRMEIGSDMSFMYCTKVPDDEPSQVIYEYGKGTITFNGNTFSVSFTDAIDKNGELPTEADWKLLGEEEKKGLDAQFTNMEYSLNDDGSVLTAEGCNFTRFSGTSIFFTN